MRPLSHFLLSYVFRGTLTAYFAVLIFSIVEGRWWTLDDYFFFIFAIWWIIIPDLQFYKYNALLLISFISIIMFRKNNAYISKKQIHLNTFKIKDKREINNYYLLICNIAEWFSLHRYGSSTNGYVTLLL